MRIIGVSKVIGIDRVGEIRREWKENMKWKFPSRNTQVFSFLGIIGSILIVTIL